MPLKTFRSWIALGIIMVLVTACGGGGSGGGNSAANNSSSNNGGTSNSGSGAPSSAPSYTVQLSWTAPTTRADGSALTASELTGYRIFYSLDGSDASTDQIVNVPGGLNTALQISLTKAGTYAFAITALDLNGLESSLSSPVMVLVN